MKTVCVILAAGEGTRMKSSVPKVLHKVCGIPMLRSIADTASGLRPVRTVIVAGRHLEAFRKELSDPDLEFVHQEEPKGTGHALMSVLPSLKGFRGVVVVLNGDTPLVRAGTIRRFLSMHGRKKNAVSVLSFEAEDPSGYGRILRDRSGGFVSIVEDKDADADQKGILEVNSGVYAINTEALHLLDSIRKNRLKKEYYLTDIVSLALRSGFGASAFCIGDEAEFLGVNTREELLRASEVMRQGIIRDNVARGVNFIDPASVFVHPHAVIGRDATLYPNVFIEGRTRIGRGVTIYPNVRISRSVIGDNAVIRDSTVIEDSVVRSGAAVGPFAHIRPGSDIGTNARVGNFVELKKAMLGHGAKASHLSYLGDAVIGRDVNIGAGTITCNYDGEKKHQTVIGDGVFVGSDTQFVAPVKVGKGSYIGAGSTITKDVPPGSLAVSRTEQRNINDWAARRRAKGRAREAKRG